MSLSVRCRPSSFDQVIGQEKAIATLRSHGKQNWPHHAFLISGPSGVGKTTLARIVAKKLDAKKGDITEYNCADMRGIDTARDIQALSTRLPMFGGKTRVIIVDEMHQQTKAAQDALLKTVEEARPTCYFFFCTTDASKVITALKTRCTKIELRSVPDDIITKFVQDMAKENKIKLESGIAEKIATASKGSPRSALNYLQNVAGVKGNKQYDVIFEDESAEVIALVRGLMFGRQPWANISKMINECKEEPETVRRIILGYASSCLLGNSSNIHTLAFKTIRIFSKPYYDTGKPALVADCFELWNQKK